LKLFKVLYGVGVLIGLYLFATHAKAFTSLIGAVASPTLKGAALLQGREKIAGLVG
jgi:hypothetical protein